MKIEFKQKKKDKALVLCDGTKIGYMYTTYRKVDDDYSIYVNKDKEVKLFNYKIKDINEKVNTFYFEIDKVDYKFLDWISHSLRIELTLKSNFKKDIPYIEIEVQPDSDNWKKPFSFIELVDTFRLECKDEKLVKYFQPDELEANGIGIKYNIDDINCSIGSAYTYAIKKFLFLMSKTVELLFNNIEKRGHENTFIENKIEFKPKYKQAAISILTYFSEILNTKYPDVDTSVSIIQKDDVVKMIIETPEGYRDIIEQTLNTYMAVVKQQSPIEDLLDDKLEILKLTNKLEIAQLEVKQINNFLLFQEKNYTERIKSLETHIVSMQEIMQNQLEFSNKSTLLQQTTIKDFLQNISYNKDLVHDFRLVIQKIDDIRNRELEKKDISDIRDKLEQISNKNQNETSELLKILEQTMYGVTSNSVFQFIQTLANNLIK